MIEKKGKKYNLIMITIDGARIDRFRQFENFNKWVKKGTLFSKTITYGPQTVTSLYAVFTGIYGNKTKANNYFGSIKFKKDRFKTLTQYLKEAGFHTRGDIINEIVLPDQGFDDLKIHDEYKDDLTQRHIGMIKESSSLREQNKNFFLYLHYSNIHTEVIKNVVKKYSDFDEVYFNNRDKNIERYDQYIKKADEYLGELLKVCEELNLFENTIFVIFSDHGISVGEKKGEKGYGRYCYDYTLKTFVNFIHPDIFPKQEITKLNRTIDIMPTILEILEIPEDTNYEKMQGESLIPFMNEESGERIAFSESAGIEEEPTNRDPHIKCLRTKDWKLIYNIDTKKKELYDLLEDPEENNNLAEQNEKKLDELWDKLKFLSPEIERPTKAVILAGGISLRMDEQVNKQIRGLLKMDNYASRQIKCLLPIDNQETILGRIVRLLKKNGVKDIVLVVGYRAEEIKNHFKDSVRYIEEPLYKKEGMLDSLCYALNEFNEPLLFMYADSVFSERTLKKIIHSNKGEITCLVSNKEVDDESEKIKINEGNIIRCNKEMENNEADGEFTGIIKKTFKGAKQFKESLETMRNSNLIEYKNVRDFIEFMIEKDIEIKPEIVSGEDWMEIDFFKEYEFAKNDFIHKIKRIDLEDKEQPQ